MVTCNESGYDQVAKTPKEFCGGKRVFLLGLSVRLFYAHIIYFEVSTDSTAVVVIRAWFVRMNM